MARGKEQIKISRLFKRFAAMFLILGAGLLVFGILQVRNLAGMQAITEDYLAGQEAISSMRDASDFLTEKSRSFTVSGNTESARDFFKEVNDTKRREKALKTIDEIATGKEETKLAEQLADAASESNRLAEIETYAMRLAAEGHGTDRVLYEVLAPAKVEVLFSDEIPEGMTHPNTLDFFALKEGKEIGRMRAASIGGGDIRIEGRQEPEEDEVYPENSFAEVEEFCRFRSSSG